MRFVNTDAYMFLPAGSMDIYNESTWIKLNNPWIYNHERKSSVAKTINKTTQKYVYVCFL